MSSTSLCDVRFLWRWFSSSDSRLQRWYLGSICFFFFVRSDCCSHKFVLLLQLSSAHGSKGGSSIGLQLLKSPLLRVMSILFLQESAKVLKSHSSKNLKTAQKCFRGKCVLCQLSHWQLGSDKFVANNQLLLEQLFTRNSPFPKFEYFASHCSYLPAKSWLLRQCFTKCVGRL